MNIPDEMNAVITADMVEYLKLSKPEADRLLKDLHELFESLDEIRTNLNSTFSIKRGDSVQVEIDNTAPDFYEGIVGIIKNFDFDRPSTVF